MQYTMIEKILPRRLYRLFVKRRALKRLKKGYDLGAAPLPRVKLYDRF